MHVLWMRKILGMLRLALETSTCRPTHLLAHDSHIVWHRFQFGSHLCIFEIETQYLSSGGVPRCVAGLLTRLKFEWPVVAMSEVLTEHLKAINIGEALVNVCTGRGPLSKADDRWLESCVDRVMNGKYGQQNDDKLLGQRPLLSSNIQIEFRRP